MSLINKMLQDLDARGTTRTEALPGQVKPVARAPYRPNRRVIAAAAGGAVAATALVWVGWTQWHRGEYGCTFAETPVECELRTHRPSFVIIQVGTHFESRNTEYLRRIILQLMDAGVVPILATKADNRELDDRINRDMALLAVEYDLPLWNFWAAVSDLPNRGLYTRDDRPLQGDIYLNEEATIIHRMTGLAALNVVWRAVAGE